MNMAKRKKGASLAELMVVMVIMGSILTGAMTLTVGTSRSYQRTNNQLEVDQNAARGIQWISQDMQEAKSFQIMSSTWIRVYFPVQSAGGTYNRKVTDTVNTIDYYRGRKNGVRDATGTYLVRSKVGDTTRAVCSDITVLNFESDSPSSVNVDVQVRKSESGKTYFCAMNHRAILMRNYQQ